MFSYDSAARIQQITTQNTGAYTRYVYGPSWVQSFSTVNTPTDEAYSITVYDGEGRAFGTVSNHPGSSGGYKLVNVIYDRMGRAVQYTRPFEINSSWVAAGDDAGGVPPTAQTYDWKGRPLRTTNPDGTYKEASYVGCGCAGGEVVTLTDEVGRRQKVYSDVLGRQWKSEVLNWDGTVYATTTSALNARDQATLVRQYAGTDQSTTYQDTTMSFDGYGRLNSRHLPQQDVGKFTNYAYYPDDHIQSITDARGASKNFVYNNRGQVSNITYSASAGIPTSAPTTLSYDAAGNRISMVDGPGRVDYVYDQLSRLTSETRRFNDSLPQAPLPNNSYRLSYGYNLAGQLTSLTDPSGGVIYYEFDATGRLQTVTGTPYAGVTSYASNAQYRASGALKHLEYGDGQQMNVTYNNRLKADNFTLGGAQTIMQKHYDYFADGRLRYAQDQLDPKFDRSYEYDHVGRIAEARSGAEARGQAESNLQNLPYHYSYRYDPFDNFQGRFGSWWIENIPNYPQTFVNNRPPGVFDADGRETDSAVTPFYSNSSFRDAYRDDASGHAATIQQYETLYEEGDPNPPEWQTGRMDSMQDGDGWEIRSVKTDYSQETHAPLSTTIYYKIRSTVLQGKTIAETNSYVQGHVDGSGYVYANGELLATKSLNIWCGSSTGGCSSWVQTIFWTHNDPGSTAKYVKGTIPSYTSPRTELDPMGSDIGTSYGVVLPPPPPEPPKWVQSGGFGQPDPEDPVILSNGRQVHCYVDGNLTGCANAFNQLRLGLAVVDEPHTEMSALSGLGHWQYVKGGERDPSRSGDVPGADGVLRTTITEKGHWEFTPEDDFDLESQSPEQERPSGGRINQGGPCDVELPQNSERREIAGTLMGEMTRLDSRQYETSQHGTAAVGHASGSQISRDGSFREAAYMVSVIENRHRDWHGGRWSYTQIVNEPKQFLGHDNGMGQLNNLGNNGSEPCERARIIMSAMEAVLDEDGVWNYSVYYWRGVEQWPPGQSPFVRTFRPLDIRIANTDFMEHDPQARRRRRR